MSAGVIAGLIIGMSLPPIRGRVYLSSPGCCHDNTAWLNHLKAGNDRPKQLYRRRCPKTGKIDEYYA